MAEEAATEAKAIQRYVRISSRKVARIAKLCVGKRYGEVEPALKSLPQQAAVALYKTIHSAASNYLVKDANANLDTLLVKHIGVDPGPTMKRLRPRARGRANRILKRMSHITVVVESPRPKSASAPKSREKEMGK